MTPDSIDVHKVKHVSDSEVPSASPSCTVEACNVVCMSIDPTDTHIGCTLRQKED